MPLQSNDMQGKNMPWISNLQPNNSIESNQFDWQQQQQPTIYQAPVQTHQLMPFNRYNSTTYTQIHDDDNLFFNNSNSINSSSPNSDRDLLYQNVNPISSNAYNFGQSQGPINIKTSFDACERIKSKKRNSFEMEEEDSTTDRPAKQILSEKKLFKKFETIHLNRDSSMTSDSSSDSDDSLEENVSTKNNCHDLNHYIYNLYSNKSNNSDKNLYNNGCDCSVIRLAREEREKLNKAVILYNPQIKYNYIASNDDNSDDMKYSNVRSYNNDSLTITDVTDEVDIDEFLVTDQQSTAQSYYEMEY